jgi:transposase
MSPIRYSILVRNSKDPALIRERMVRRYYETRNYSQVAREFGTKRQRVKFWVERFEKEGIDGLRDKSRAPHNIPHKTSKDVEEKIKQIAISRKYSIGQDRIQLELLKRYDIKVSTSTINRIMHEHGLIKRALKKHQKKMNITKYRKKLKALRDWQIDVKDLIDIPNIFALIKLGILPRYQYSAKDVVTGVSFFCYAFEHSEINSIRFAQAILEHLKGYGINLREITFQTDNGSEFIGCIFKKKPSGFTELVEKVYLARHQTIPVGRKEYNGSVESFHARIEKEFYDIETFNSLGEFLSKAWTFELYWNLERENLKLKKTPFQIVKEKCAIYDPGIVNFQPFILDEVRTFWIPHYQKQSVPYVADEIINRYENPCNQPRFNLNKGSNFRGRGTS